MAVRRPLKISGSDLQQMSDADIETIQLQMIHLWSENPTVTLSVVGAGGNLGTITDERLLAGDLVHDGEVTEVSKKTISYSRINQTIDSSAAAVVDTNNTAYPVYYNDSGHIQAMNDSDFQDTFISPALNTLTSSNTTTDQAGTYFVSSTNLVADADLVSAIPVFVDTLADADAFTSGPIPEDSDQFITVNTYYLHKLRKTSAAVSYENFLLIDSDNNIREMNDSDNNSLLQNYIRWAAVNLNNNKLRYSYTSGNTRGTAMIDTILDSDNAILREGEVNSPFDYDVQEVPAGTPIVNQTHYLRVNLV
jgi:hypothetical protein